MTSLASETRESLGELAGEATLIVPVGAVEQHGPHLPVGVDSMIVAHVAAGAAEHARQLTDAPLFVAPVISYGSSHHHLPYAGTLSLTSRTLSAVLEDLLGSAAAWGVRRVVILNGHGGNEAVAHQAVRDAALRYEGRFAAASYWTLAWSELCEEARRWSVAPVPGHAGAFETALVLALRAELVDPDRRGSLRPGGTPATSIHPLSQAVIEEHRWVQAIDGYSDDTASASVEAGSAMLDCIVAATARFVATFASDGAAEGGPDGST